MGVNVNFKPEEESQVQVFQYAGVGRFRIGLVNPTKQELFDTYGIELNKEPEYIIKNESGVVTDIRLKFYGELTNTDESFKVIHSYTIFLKRGYRTNSEAKQVTDGVKCEYIDRFGNTTWGTVDGPTKRAGAKFDYNGPVHKAFIGEPELISFLSACYSQIQNPFNYDAATKAFELKPGDWSQSEIFFDKKILTDIWKGDLTELLSILRCLCTCKACLKILVGTSADPSHKYALTFRDKFIRNRNSIEMAIGQFSSHIDKLAKNGRMPKDNYPLEEVHEITSINNMTSSESIKKAQQTSDPDLDGLFSMDSYDDSAF